jgi:hypothetical protein
MTLMRLMGKISAHRAAGQTAVAVSNPRGTTQGNDRLLYALRDKGAAGGFFSFGEEGAMSF